MVDNYGSGLARVIKQHRTAMRLTLRALAAASGISTSHLGRIERGERFPSAYILRTIAKPLGFSENELFMLAGYLSHPSPTEVESHESDYDHKRLDPYVARVLAREPVEVQRAIIGILSILKSIAKGIEE